MPVLNGKAYWASIANPNTTFEPVWSIDLAIDSDNRKKAIDSGLAVKNKDDERGDFITFKRKVTSKSGNTNNPPSLKDSQKRDIKGTLVGNGSDVNVLYKTYEWSYAGKSGIGADLQAVQVINLVEYLEGEDFDVIPNGYETGDNLDSDEIPF
tara:strand:- start:1938 stop:2396 length:459 start_codon:yes stop_codon:yes gene_type:complete